MNLQPWQDVCAALEGSQARLVAVSKYTSDANVEALLQAGQIEFGESRPQNLRDRATKFPSARWHFIGPLQKNKAKYIARYAAMWHSLADIETAKAVAAQLKDRVLPVLIQVNVSGEAQKQGVAAADLKQLCTELSTLPQLQVVGLMGMAAKQGDARAAFQSLRLLRDDLQREYGTVCELSMGMSGDWQTAIEEDATLIRLGSMIFNDD